MLDKTNELIKFLSEKYNSFNKSDVKFITANEAYEKLKDRTISEQLYAKIDYKREIFVEDLYNQKISLLEKLEKLYNYTDEYNSPNKKDAVCQKGCSFCCKIPVDISEIEVQYIEQNTKFKRKNIKVINVYENCPFLDVQSNACSIYTCRPLVCRCFFTFDNPSYCKINQPHVIVALKNMEEIEASYNKLLRISGNILRKDIRNYFR